MPTLSRRLLAAALACTAVAAFAQDNSNKNDMFGQPVTGLGATAPVQGSAPQRRTTITNNNYPGQEGPQDNDAYGEPGNANATGFYPDGTPYRNQAMQQNVRNGAQRQTLPLRREPPSEFQKFLFENTGKVLPVFGSEFFANTPATFTPIAGAPVTADYPLGIGDELLIRGWGSIDIDFRATIDRNGLISIPTIGSVSLAGVKAGEAEGVVRAAVARLYKGVTVNVSFGKLRAITVYVVGQAKRPGTYTVSSLSTLVTALFSSGGPNANGSMRHLQVKRGGKVVAELDLYAFIAKGDKSADIKLQDGDSIFIPPASGFVALTGMVNAPAVYELKAGGDTVESLLDIAGGLPVVADPRRVFLERIDPSKSQPRSVEQFALDAAGRKHALKNGDVVNVTSITPDFSNAVVLRGNVDQPVRMPFKAGMKVSDLIPNREYLISRDSIRRQNNVLSTNESETSRRNGELPRDGAMRDYDQLRNNNGYRDNGYRDNGYRDNGATRDNGLARSNTQDNGNLRDRNGERTSGRDATDSIAARIGGLIDEINWDYAVVERINRSDLTVSLIPFNLGKVFSNPAGPDNVLLQPGDTVTIFSHTDVAVPMEKRRIFVRIEGEVNVPGVYQMGGGETLQALLARAGGPTSNAYLFGTAFYREQVRKEQEANLEKAALRLESQLRSAQSKSAANARPASAADAAVAESQRQAEMALSMETLSRFRQLKPTGRIAFGLEMKERSFARLPALKLENGDRLVIPARPEFVHIFGAVNAEASPLWRANSRVKDYMLLAGVTADADVDNVFVMRVDGTVVSKGSNGWLFGSVGSMEVMPGDSIVVPEKLDKETAWTKFTNGTREWAQIFANFGLGAAAVKTLRQ